MQKYIDVKLVPCVICAGKGEGREASWGHNIEGVCGRGGGCNANCGNARSEDWYSVNTSINYLPTLTNPSEPRIHRYLINNQYS